MEKKFSLNIEVHFAFVFFFTKIIKQVESIPFVLLTYTYVSGDCNIITKVITLTALYTQWDVKILLSKLLWMRKVNEGKKIVKIKQKIRFQMKKMKHTKAITTQDFNKICRFCAKPCSELKPIFKSDDYADNTSVDDRSVSVPYLFQNSLNLDVWEAGRFVEITSQ